MTVNLLSSVHNATRLRQMCQALQFNTGLKKSPSSRVGSRRAGQVAVMQRGTSIASDALHVVQHILRPFGCLA